MNKLSMLTVLGLLMILPALPFQASFAKGVLDHFKCYPITQTEPVNEFVKLQDQFDDPNFEQAFVHTAVVFCNPVEKTDASGTTTSIQNRAGHLKMYLIFASTTAPTPTTITVLNQLSTSPQPLVLFQPVVLAVPTRKQPLPAPTGLDHFKCYIAKGTIVGVTVDLKDQFDKDKEHVLVLDPVVFCNPVEKTRDGEVTEIGNPDGHLTCYRFTPASTTSKIVHTDNQFDKEEFKVKGARYLCVPSEKRTGS